ncbi:MAG: hypothetical protein F6J93_28140 [Oscillatoria sp. SIO1A7]|nr:hypothetical protein [Oscillatoria sp. SIO1A7]
MVTLLGSLPLETRNLRSRRTFPAQRDRDNSMKFPHTPHPTPYTLHPTPSTTRG